MTFSHTLTRLTMLLTICSTLALGGCKSKKAADNTSETEAAARVTAAFSADSAYASIVKQCEFGCRVPGSEAHKRCGDYIVSEFTRLGLSVTEQKADLRGYDGTLYHNRNIIGAYKADLADRIVICAHWDSRPWADADPDTLNHRKPVMAANDGASGVAVMFELARLIKEIDPPFGIDFVAFDTEDCGAPYWDEDNAPEDGSDWCLGSRYWASHLKEGYRPRYGILLDMVGGSDARYLYEGFSMRYASDVMLRLWDAANRADAAHLFLTDEGGYATDDHVAMNETAGIPTVDIIPFVEGPHSFGATWHTTSDTPQNISKETLRAVGQTLLQFLYEETLR